MASFSFLQFIFRRSPAYKCFPNRHGWKRNTNKRILSSGIWLTSCAEHFIFYLLWKLTSNISVLNDYISLFPGPAILASNYWGVFWRQIRQDFMLSPPYCKYRSIKSIYKYFLSIVFVSYYLVIVGTSGFMNLLIMETGVGADFLLLILLISRYCVGVYDLEFE